ncbi:conserved hypothetical protein [Yersinia enterocolitica subsp. enterocolitica 8081]|uniref:Uncharacterized protein n=1 Tax=Yersinia enterocolitica serotype O:8 / biotype 1B (strain NCTC 13174 / 8081) TaxID=393305 RepID=A1JKK8_YERE8|nr:conserved hypothetical protein [Yersinia enterocolitica subsp. enterocolitica 8081]
MQGEDWQKSKASAPGRGLRRLYDLPVFTVTGTLSLTSKLKAFYGCQSVANRS